MPHFVKTFLKMRFVPSEEFYSALSYMPPTPLPRHTGCPQAGRGEGESGSARVRAERQEHRTESQSWQTQACLWLSSTFCPFRDSPPPPANRLGRANLILPHKMLKGLLFGGSREQDEHL